MLAEESAPCRDETRGIAPERVHVGKVRPAAVAAKRALQRPRALGSDRHQDRFGVGERIGDERVRGRQKLVLVAVDQRLVPEAITGPMHAHDAGTPRRPRVHQARASLHP